MAAYHRDYSNLFWRFKALSGNFVLESPCPLSRQIIYIIYHENHRHSLMSFTHYLFCIAVVRPVHTILGENIDINDLLGICSLEVGIWVIVLID